MGPNNVPMERQRTPNATKRERTPNSTIKDLVKKRKLSPGFYSSETKPSLRYLINKEHQRYSQLRLNRAPESALHNARNRMYQLRVLNGRSQANWNTRRQEHGLHMIAQKAANKANMEAKKIANQVALQHRKNAEHEAFLKWRAKQQNAVQKEVNAGISKVPNVASSDFQMWMKALFQRHHRGTGVKPWLLRYMRTPKSTSGYETLARLVEGGDDACKSEVRPDVSSIQAHQAVIHVMAQLRAADAIKTGGLLVMHSTGAGKTLSCLAVMLAFWNKTVNIKGREHPMPIVLLSTNDNRKENDTHKFAELGMLMFADFKDELHGDMPFAAPPGAPDRYWTSPELKKRIAARIDQRLKMGLRSLMPEQVTTTQQSRTIYTFAELGNDMKLGLSIRNKKCVFIVDEIRNLCSQCLAGKQAVATCLSVSLCVCVWGGGGWVCVCVMKYSSKCGKGFRG